MKKLLTLTVAMLLLTSCGYKPSSHYTKKIVGENVYTEVEVSLSDPENAVLIKDALNRALYRRLKSKATRKRDADSSIYVAYDNIRFVPLQYNKNGYVVHYQAYITLGFTFIKGEVTEKRQIVGRYEFPIRPSAIISNDLRFKAIEQGSIKALDQFIAYISAKGLLTHEK
jgi:hypothetical protein